MVSGRAEKARDDSLELLRHRYLAAHPSAEVSVGFGDFAFFSIVIDHVHLVAGFGRIVDLNAADVLTDLRGAEALVAAEPEILDHMNGDHADTLNLYATKLLGAEAGAWRATGCDPDGLDMQDGGRTLRLEFPQRVVSPSALRQVLKELAEQGRARGA
jgi:putative heme iron utilization protein